MTYTIRAVADHSNERMDALTEAIVRLLRRMEDVERRLTRLEAASKTGALSEPPPGSSAPELEALPARPAAAAAPSPVEPPVLLGEEAERRETDTRRLETRLGLTWINRAGVITMVLAVAFFFKYAVDNRWIGEKGRVVLGVIAGCLALALAEQVYRRGHRIYSQGICGGGIAVLYLSFYASFGFYHLVPQAAAFALMALATALAGALALRYDSPAMLVLGLAGGYATPLLLSAGEDRPWFFFGFVFLLNLGAMATARPRGWRRVEVLACGATALLYYLWLTGNFNDGEELPATVWAMAFFAQFAASAVGLPEAMQLLALVGLLTAWSRHAAFLPLSLAVSCAGLALSDLRRREWTAAFTAGAFWFFVWLWYEDLAEGVSSLVVLGWLTAAFLLFLACLPWRITVRRTAPGGLELALAAANSLVYFSFGYSLLGAGYDAYRGLFAAALAGLHVGLGHMLRRRLPADQPGSRTAEICAGLGLVFLTLAVPIQFSGYRITMAWAIEAAVLVWIGSRAGVRRLSLAALLVFLFVLGRLWFVDAGMYRDSAPYAAISNLRFLTFLIGMAALWAASHWLEDRRSRLATYVAGHAVLLSALLLEAAGWAARVAAPENVASVRSAAISILTAAYAMSLVLVGILARSGLTRLLGLLLVAAVVLKLYLHDVWLLRRIYRVTAFAVLGVLLLVTSFLYSRYRGVIEDWWKQERPGS